MGRGLWGVCEHRSPWGGGVCGEEGCGGLWTQGPWGQASPPRTGQCSVARGTAGGSVGVPQTMPGVPPGEPRESLQGHGRLWHWPGRWDRTGRWHLRCHLRCHLPAAGASSGHPNLGHAAAPQWHFRCPTPAPRPPPPHTRPLAAAGAHVPRQVMEQGEEDREYRGYRRLGECEEDSPPGEEEEEQLLLHVTEGPTGTGVPSGGDAGFPWAVWGPQVGVPGSLLVPGGGGRVVPRSHLTPLGFSPQTRGTTSRTWTVSSPRYPGTASGGTVGDMGEHGVTLGGHGGSITPSQSP